jgi:hypothetical protein
MSVRAFECDECQGMVPAYEVVHCTVCNRAVGRCHALVQDIKPHTTETPYMFASPGICSVCVKGYCGLCKNYGDPDLLILKGCKLDKIAHCWDCHDSHK